MLVVCHMGLAGQPAELAPLLPPEQEITRDVRQALVAGDLARANELSNQLADPQRAIWRGLFAIVRNEPANAIRLLPRTGTPKLLGVAYYMVRQHILFRQQMEEAIRTTPADFGPYYYLGRHYDSDVDNPEEAARWFRQALERRPDFIRARAYLGYCLERSGKMVEAEREYRQSLRIPQSLAGMARLRLAENDTRGAAEWIDKAMAAESRDVGIVKLAARIYADAARRPDSLRALELAAQLAPRDATVPYQLWRAYQAIGEPAKAAQAKAAFERLRSIYGMGK